MATGKLTAHVIVYNPNKKAVDYNIAYECGFILRLYESPEEQRLQFASTEAGRKAIRELVTAPGGIAKRMSLPDPLIDQFTEQLFGGLMTQLRSVPIGMRIDQWLWEGYPGLRELQKVSESVYRGAAAGKCARPESKSKSYGAYSSIQCERINECGLRDLL